jgi:hypothetical protein
MCPPASDFHHADARLFIGSLLRNGADAFAAQLSHQITTRSSDPKEAAKPASGYPEFDEGGSPMPLNALAMIANMTNLQASIETSGGRRFTLHLPASVMDDVSKALRPAAVNDRECLSAFPRVEHFGGPLNTILDYLFTVARGAGYELEGQGDKIIRLLSTVNGVCGDLHRLPSGNV